MLPTGFAQDPVRSKRLEREARVVAALSHPNILAIHDFGSCDGVTDAAMELLPVKRFASTSSSWDGLR